MAASPYRSRSRRAWSCGVSHAWDTVVPSVGRALRTCELVAHDLRTCRSSQAKTRSGSATITCHFRCSILCFWLFMARNLHLFSELPPKLPPMLHTVYQIVIIQGWQFCSFFDEKHQVCFISQRISRIRRIFALQINSDFTDFKRHAARVPRGTAK